MGSKDNGKLTILIKTSFGIAMLVGYFFHANAHTHVYTYPPNTH